MGSFKQKFGKRLKELRKSKGFTQEQLAEKSGIEPPNISKLESGMHFPQPENIEKFANVLDVEIKDMFDFQHFSKRGDLSKKIKNYVDSAPQKEIEFLYKIIENLQQFKK